MLLDETLIDDTRSEVILQLLENIQTKISTDNNYLTGKHLNGLRKTVRQYLVGINEINMSENEIEKDIFDGCYEDELPVKNYQRGFDLLRSLIKGHLTYNAGSEINYWDD